MSFVRGARPPVLSLVFPLAAALIAGCATPRPAASVAGAGEPLNLSDAKAAVCAYVDSGAYARDFAAASAEARVWIEHRAATRRPGERLAVVLDIDETVLSNLPHMRAEDFGYNQRDWEEWVDSGSAPILEPMREVFAVARAHDVAVLFLTGRKDPRDRQGTENSLRRGGLGDHAALRLATRSDATLPTAAARKTAARAAWAAEGWVIIANIGDQESDLVGGHAERAFKLPNPFYRIL